MSNESASPVVYVAEQSEPVRRRVALKLIKAGMDGKQVIARFEAERQALSIMDHPNIARVLDAGATETGRPMKGFVFIESAGLRTDRQLRDWVSMALSFAENLPRKSGTKSASRRLTRRPAERRRGVVRSTG
jgi:serine/threonine protein kinase